MNKTLIVPLVAAIAIAGCAKRPSAISPAVIPANAYSNLNCDELASTLAAEKQNLATLSAAQNKAATADAVGVFLIGVPAASLTNNDKEGDIAVSKGKVLSIESVALQKKCA